MHPERNIPPHVGGAVVVSHFDRHHVVRTAIAHVLAISGGTHLSTPEGVPALTVAFPDPAADLAVLQGPTFARAYRREVGVVHHSHPEARTGRHSIVWGHALDQEQLNDEALLEGPEHSSANSVFDRHQPEHIPAEVPAGLHGAPTLRSELTTTVDTDAGPVLMPTDPTSAESVEAAQKGAQPSEADLDAVVEEQGIVKKTGGKRKPAPEGDPDDF